MKTRLTRIALTLAVLVGLAVLAAYTQYQRQHAALEAVIADARAAGIPTTYAELIAAYPPPPDAENAAIDYVEAFETWQTIYGNTSIEKLWAHKEIRVTWEFPETLPKLDAATWELAVEARDTFQPVIDALYAGSDKPACQFLGPIADTPADVTHYWLNARNLLQWVIFDFLCATHTGDQTRADRALIAYLRIQNHLVREPGELVPYTQATQQFHEHANRVASLLGGRAPGNLLSDAWDALGDPERFRMNLLCNLVTGLERDDVSYVKGRDDNLLPPIRDGFAQARFYYATTDVAAAARIKLDALRYFPDQLPQGIALIAAERTAATGTGFTNWLFLDVLGQYEYLYTYAGYDIAHTRILHLREAYRQYVADTGAPPDTLEELVPQYIDAIPIDPFDGQPLRFTTFPDGTPVLYSVGPNGFDDTQGSTNPAKNADDFILPVADVPEPTP